MKSTIFSAAFLFTTIISISSYGAQKTTTDDITSSSIEWKHGEPAELVGTNSYKKWIKEFGITDAITAQKLGNSDHSIRYAHMDVTNSGSDEILVQEASWAARGYAFAIFKKQGATWQTIVQHRGAFFFTRSNTKKPYNLTLIDKYGADYDRYELLYINNKYQLKNATHPYKGISFEDFWSLNLSKSELCTRDLQNHRNGNKASNSCEMSPSDLKEKYSAYCNETSIKSYKLNYCNP